MSESYDVAIIGAGPGGYVAAIRSAQLGMKTALIERRKSLGGTCLNIGCIPSKALLDSSEKFYETKNDLRAHGVIVESVFLDLDAMMSRKETVVDQLTGGVATLMKKHGVEVIGGSGRVARPGVVEVAAGTSREIAAKSVVLATGSVSQELSFLPVDGDVIVDSESALSFKEVPEELVVVGAGAIGLELGSVWARLGSKVTIVEIMDSVLPGWDAQIARTLPRYLKQIGMEIRTATKITGVELKEGKAELVAEQKDGREISLVGDKVLVAVGRIPCIGDELNSLGVNVENGRIVVNESFESSVPGIYAIGDTIAGPMLAHKAEEDGIACIEGLSGIPTYVDYRLVPNVVYTWPEAASVGETEDSLKAGDVQYVKGSFPFRANGRALAAGEAEGFVKILAEPDTSRILGAHILGPYASALIAEIVAVMAVGGNAEDLGRIVHAHPTLPEAVKEAGLAVLGAAIHSS